MRRRLVAVVWLGALAALVGACAKTPADYTEAEARRLIEARGYALEPEDFVRSVQQGALDVVIAFLAAGLDLGQTDGRPLFLAAAGGETEIVELLLDAGADPDLKGGGFGQTALVGAVMRRQMPVVRLLLARGAAPDARPLGGATALFYVQDVETARLLLDAGADPNARDGSGGTPLTSAIMIGDRELVELLLDRGADPNAADFLGRTPLHYCEVYRFSGIAALLRDAGAVRQLPSVRAAQQLAYAGRYASTDQFYQVLFDAGELLLVESDHQGGLLARRLIPLAPHRFYCQGDPGLVAFEFRMDGERVTGLARSQGASWVYLPRVEPEAGEPEAGE